MTKAPLLEDHLIKPPNYAVQASPCGCTVITFPARCVVAVPCDRHVGMTKVTIEPTSDTAFIECACGCGASRPKRASEWGVSGNVIVPRTQL